MKETIRDRRDFAIVTPSFLDDYGLDPYEFRLYLHIVRRAGRQGCFESIPNMAKHCLISEKIVRRSLRLLVKANLIAVIEQREGKTTIYEITPHDEWVNAENLLKIRGSLTPGRSATTTPGRSATTTPGRSATTTPGRSATTTPGRSATTNIKEINIKEIPLKEEGKTPLTPRRNGGEVEEEKPTEKCSDGLNAEESALDSPDQQNPESLTRTDDLSLGQISPATLAPIETTASRVRRTWQETGILPSEPLEFEAWVQEDLGHEIIALYRKSGRIATTTRGDINPGFAKYVAAQWPGKDVDYGYAKIRKMEREPHLWEILAAMVVKWQASIHTGKQEINLVQEMGKQEKQGPPVVNFGGRRI